MSNRLFVTFKPNTSLSGFVMVFQDMTRNEVWDRMILHYGYAVDTILTEQELAEQNKVIPEDKFVLFGTECVYQDLNSGVVTRYPVKLNLANTVTLEPITKWFKVAVPNPTDDNKLTQIAAHMEEFAEMLTALGHTDYANYITELSNKYYAKEVKLNLTDEQHTELLDSLADQTVTGTGVAYMLGYQWDKALTEVNQSNFSKFEDGKPVFREDGKIMKGKNYFKPDLAKFTKRTDV